MITEKLNPDASGYWIALLLLLAIVVTHGREAMEWLLMRLYEFFIQKGS